MTDKMRSEFEKWAVSEGMPITRGHYYDVYASAETRAAYLAWQAARTVPEKKVLPELFMAEYHEAKGWNACVDAMLSAAPEGKK